MRTQMLCLLLTLFVLAALALIRSPVASLAQPGPQPAPPNFVFINYTGQDVTLDLDDQTYIVPGIQTRPSGGRLELQLASGEHRYGANVPGGEVGASGTFVIPAEGGVGLAARLEQQAAVVDQAGIVIEEPRLAVYVFAVNPFSTPPPPTPVVDSWQPQPAPAGQGRLIWVNDTGWEVTVDVNGTAATIAPAAQGIPGRTPVDLVPGLVRYTVSVPRGSLNGEINLLAGQVLGFHISAELSPPLEYEVGQPVPTLPPVVLRLSTEDLTARAAPTSDRPMTPTPQTKPSAEATTTPPGTAGLRVKNYADETLTLTINNRAYAILDRHEATISLPPGEYTYTASIPILAVNGTVDLVPGRQTELSVAINVAHDALSVYQD